MNRYCSGVFIILIALVVASCSRGSDDTSLPKATAFGVAIVESSGGKQTAQTGSLLPQPVVVQVNDEQGTGVAGALVEFSAAPGVAFDHSSGLTDSSGQVAVNVSLGGMAGRYQIAAATMDKSHKKVEVKIEEIALGYQQTLGRNLNDQYCDRCHNAESTVERVSNFDNLEIKPHPFTEGETLNKINDCGSDGHHQPRRARFEQISPDAGLGEHAQQVRNSGADILYPCHFRSPLSQRWSGVCEGLACFCCACARLSRLHGRRFFLRTKFKTRNCVRCKSATWTA